MHNFSSFDTPSKKSCHQWPRVTAVAYFYLLNSPGSDSGYQNEMSYHLDLLCRDRANLITTKIKVLRILISLSFIFAQQGNK